MTGVLHCHTGLVVVVVVVVVGYIPAHQHQSRTQETFHQDKSACSSLVSLTSHLDSLTVERK